MAQLDPARLHMLMTYIAVVGAEDPVAREEVATLTVSGDEIAQLLAACAATIASAFRADDAMPAWYYIPPGYDDDFLRLTCRQLVVAYLNNDLDLMCEMAAAHANRDHARELVDAMLRMLCDVVDAALRGEQS